MIDPDAFAALLCDWCLEVRERESVLVSTTPLRRTARPGLPPGVITRGAWPPGLRIAIPGLAEDFYRLAGDELLDNFSPQDLADAEQADAFLAIHAPENTRALSGVDPAVITRAARALDADPGGADGQALVRHDLADAGAGAARGDERRRLRRVRQPRPVPRPARTRRRRGAS